ncbi:peritrophin-1-like, partial [Rhagoletis pomonella]|uniref:peritrophin-1-like n=1 Tax=Rhagoletis pomonella TaxID=28610 RepID=UPI00177BB06F
MACKFSASQTNLLYLMIFCLWIATAVTLNERLEQTFRHPDCPLADDPMHPIHLPYPSDCHKYYTCKNGYAYAMLCQNELQWSVTTYRCDFPSVANCNNTHPNPIDSTYGGAFPASEGVIFKTDAKDCNRFYSCMPMRCPPSQHWNGMLNRCDSPQNTICDASAQ